MRKTLPVLCALALAALVGRDAAAYNQSALKWQTIKTEHFEVHYHEGARWTAEQVAQIAEEVHGPLTQLYEYEPNVPVHFVIKDTDDYANGAAYFYDNKVEIWATNLEFGLRGTTDWLRNVVTHEYTHIISIQAAYRLPKRMPAVYVQGIGFEQEKRADVLQGYPNVIASYPIAGVSMPPWFAEGVSQYQSPYKQYDCWDSHRDMILRTAVLEDKMLTYDEMGFFGKSSLKSEQVYDHGYGMVRYIVDTYGYETLQEITRQLKSWKNFTMDGALKKATGKSGEELYADWKADLEERYAAQLAPVRDDLRTGVAVAPDNIDKRQLRWTADRWRWQSGEFRFGIHTCRRCGMQFSAGGDDARLGFMTHSPAFSHDGSKVAFLSNKGRDFATTSIFIMDSDGSDARRITGSAASPPRFSPDDTKLVFSRKDKVDKYGSTVNDLYVYDLAKRKEKRITEKSRCADADFSPDGGTIVCVQNEDGTHRMMLVDAAGGNMRELFAAAKGTQLYQPHYSPDGKTILFGIFDGASRDIALIDADGSNFRYLVRTPSDERDAKWTMSGDGVVFASDRTGIFNIYELDIESNTTTQLTNVIGGAFMPELSPDRSSLFYAGYTGDGYRVFSITQPDAAPVVAMDEARFAERTAGPFDECARLRRNAMARESGETAEVALASADDPRTTIPGEGTTTSAQAAGGPSLTSEKYNFRYTPFQFFPRFIIYDGTPRFGLFLNSFEMLDKQGLFLGGSLGTNGEYDGFLRYEIRNLFPVLWGEFFIIREKATDKVLDDDPTSPSYQHTFDFDLRYDLWQADFGLTFELGPAFNLTRQNDLSLYWSHGEYRVNVDAREFQEDGSFLVSSDGGWKYYVGDQAHLRWRMRTIAAAVDAGINPRGGRDVILHYMRSFDDLFTTGEFEYAFRPVLSKNHYNQYTLDWREYIGVPWWRSSLRLRLYGSIIDETVDDFFWVYLGGLDGIRGYTYYSIGGRKGLVGSATYRFPIFRNINRQFAQLYLRDVFGGVFVEAANAWEGGALPGSSYKVSAGYELRMNMGSFYLFPTTMTFTGAYAFDETLYAERPFGIATPLIKVQEPTWRYYFTLGFAFDT